MRKFQCYDCGATPGNCPSEKVVRTEVDLPECGSKTFIVRAKEQVVAGKAADVPMIALWIEIEAGIVVGSIATGRETKGNAHASSKNPTICGERSRSAPEK